MKHVVEQPPKLFPLWEAIFLEIVLKILLSGVKLVFWNLIPIAFFVPEGNTVYFWIPVSSKFGNWKEAMEKA